jgi:hypothetical protein
MLQDPAAALALAGAFLDVAADQYGAREELPRRANLLLSEEALRGLATSYESQLDEALAQPVPGKERMNWAAAKASAA